MNDDRIRDLVNESVARAIAAKDAEIAGAIAEGLRVYADRPVGEKGSPSLQYGVVEQVNDTYAFVTLDGQTDAVPINMLGGLVEGERVAVFLIPPSGNLAIGMVTPSVVGSLPPGGTADQVLTKIDATDGNADWETPSPSGGFPIEDGSYASSGPTTIATTTFGPLSFDALLDGDSLLDISTPTAPTVLADGLFIFSFTVQQTALITTPFQFECLVRPSGGLTVRIAETTGAAPFDFASVTLAAKMVAGDEVQAAFFNHDPAIAATVALVAEVVRVDNS